jgi:Arc/MetJ-type ribon-helix-helix transcriptional regulator
MSTVLCDEQVSRVRSLMTAGQFADESSVVDAALDLLERRQKFRAMVQEGIDAIERGDVVELDEAMRIVRSRIAEVAAENAVEV